MPARNIKVLSQDELDYLNSIYQFEYDDDMVAVMCKGRISIHDANKKFTISTPISKITLTLDAIEYWKKQIHNYVSYSLFDIQNTMNLLKVIYQEVNYENVINYLRNDIKQIKTI